MAMAAVASTHLGARLKETASTQCQLPAKQGRGMRRGRARAPGYWRGGAQGS